MNSACERQPGNRGAARGGIQPYICACPPSAQRGGFTAIEMLVAGMVLGTLMAIMIPTLVWSAHEYRLSQEREEAAAEVANIVERLTMQPWASLTPETGRGIRLSSWTEQQLRDASLTVQIGVEPDDPTAKRIHVNIAWTEHAGEPAAPVRLTAWVYQREDSP